MRHRRIEKRKVQPIRATSNNAYTQNGSRVEKPRSATNGDQEAYAKTQADLATVLEKLEELTEKVSKLSKGESEKLIERSDHHKDHWLTRFQNGKPGSLLAILSSTVSVIPLLYSLSIFLLQRLSLPPMIASSWTIWTLLRSLLPAAVILGISAIMVLVGTRIQRKSTRLKFLRSMMICYGILTIPCLGWMSLSFLNYNTLPSGVFFTLTWVGAISIVRTIRKEVKDVSEMIRVQVSFS